MLCRLVQRFASTVDPAEMQRFAVYKWWNPNNVLHPFSDLRAEYIKTRLQVQNFKGLRILDVGCGGGIMSERLGRLGASIVGIDPSQEAINVASLHLPKVLKENVEYRNCELSAVDEKFDVVLASEVIEHVTDPQVFLNDLSGKVKDNGAVFLTTVSKTPESWLLGIVASEYVLKIVDPGTHQWEKFISPEDLTRMCNLSGLEVHHSNGWFVDFLKFRAFFTSYSRLGYLFHCTKPPSQ